MGFVPIEWNRIGNLVWRGVDFHVQAELVEPIHDRIIKFGHWLRSKLEYANGAVTFQDTQFVVDEIKVDLERIKLVWNGRSGQAT